MLHIESNDLLQARINLIERNLRLLEGRTPKPFHIIDSKNIRGFRFASPSAVHYVILNVASSVSLLRSLMLLKEIGFRNELMILCRSLMELNTKLAYVVGGISADGIDRKTSKFLDDFFSDGDRSADSRGMYKPIAQKDIHRRNSESVSRDIEILKRAGIRPGAENSDHASAKAQSALYRTFSNHVHGRYPEMMDIYGEKTVELKLAGNTESVDLDFDTDNEFLAHLIEATVARFRIALMMLKTAGLTSLSNDEIDFCLGDFGRDGA